MHARSQLVSYDARLATALSMHILVGYDARLAAALSMHILVLVELVLFPMHAPCSCRFRERKQLRFWNDCDDRRNESMRTSLSRSSFALPHFSVG